MPGGKHWLPKTRERLQSRVRVLPNGCHEWTGYVNKSGYGACSYKGRRNTLAHRAFYMEFVGPIPDDLPLDHLCHTRDKTCSAGDACPHRRCVNVEHLEPVTNAENAARGQFARTTHCPAGHPYDDTNTDVRYGRRFCLACRRARNASQPRKTSRRVRIGVAA